MFLIPLLLGFSLNSASAFTTFYSGKLGERNGRLVCILLRNVVGIPVWAIGYAMAAKVSSTTLFRPLMITTAVGWLFILAGVVIIGVGIRSLRWRAAAPSTHDTLIQHRLYAYIRHPLYSGMILELAGLFLIIPTLTILVACTLGVIWVMVQARLEEKDLVKRLPAYREYMQRVPRFIPVFKA
jgi:protein-S-isoprenylcysteine O-methyltransferase Ste14